MIKKLQKRLTLLFICSVMGIFTVVFCLFIHESIQSKKENEMNFFTRMIIVGQLSRQIFMPFIMNLENVCSVHEHTIPFIA